MNNYIFPSSSRPDVKRAGHNLSTKIATTSNIGVAQMVYHRLLLPGDRFVVKPSFYLETFATTLPLNSSLECRLDFFVEPLSSLYGDMDNNDVTKSTDFLQKKRHSISIQDTIVKAPGDDSKGYPIPSNGMLEAAGFRSKYIGGRRTTTETEPIYPKIQADALLSFWDVYRNYYVNPQEDTFPYINTWSSLGLQVNRCPLSALDVLIKAVRWSKVPLEITDNAQKIASYFKYAAEQTVSPDNSSVITNNLASLLMSMYPGEDEGGNIDVNCTYSGCPLITYKPDLLRNAVLRDSGFQTQIDTSDGNFTVSTFRLKNAIQNFVERYDISGGRFTDWLRTIWDTKPKINVHKPEYVGGVMSLLTFNDVISTQGGSALGEQAALGRSNSANGRPLIIRADQYSMLIGIITIRPRVFYGSQIDAEDMQLTFGDIYSPTFAGLGYLPVPYREYVAAGDIESTVDTTFGRRAAWASYTTDLDKSGGLFKPGESLEGFVFNRRYTAGNQFVSGDQYFINPDMTSYIYPELYNAYFNNAQNGASNIRTYINLDISAIRPLPKYYKSMLS